jgi:hypothetical protein
MQKSGDIQVGMVQNVMKNIKNKGGYKIWMEI